MYLKKEYIFLTIGFIQLVRCSLSTPSPAPSLKNDISPRIIGTNKKTHKLNAGTNFNILEGKTDGKASYNYGINILDGVNVDFILAFDFVEMTSRDTTDTPLKIEKYGGYIGGQLKKSMINHNNNLWAHGSYFINIGLGNYDSLIVFSDISGGCSVGLNNKYFNPYVVLGVGYSQPLWRNVFEFPVNEFGSNNIIEIGNYKFVSSLWFVNEYGFEIPFGKRDEGFKMNYSLGWNLYRKLEKNLDSNNPLVYEDQAGLEWVSKFGFAWIY